MDLLRISIDSISSWETISLLLVAGFLVGLINTFAGSGTVITYYLFMALGLTVGEANGTNRMGVVAQTFSTSWIFFQKKILDVKTGLLLSVPTVIGTILGAEIAVRIPDKILEQIIGFFMILIIASVFFKPEKWLKGKSETSEKLKLPWFQFIIFFVIGLYGGFIHIGVGIFMLAALVLVSGYDLLHANALKVFIVFVYSPFALIIFMINGQVEYGMALISSVGNLFGGMLAARLSVQFGTNFLRWVLSAVLIFFTADLLGFFSFLRVNL
jgi:uncharacterized membrane protein YfcA